MRKVKTDNGAFRKFLERQLQDEEIRIVYEEEEARTSLAVEMARLRKERGLTQAELAVKAGTTQAVISRMESGKDKRTPSLSLLSKLANAMGAKMVICFEANDQDSSDNFLQNRC